jgi:hypothetical protein
MVAADPTKMQIASMSTLSEPRIAMPVYERIAEKERPRRALNHIKGAAAFFGIKELM